MHNMQYQLIYTYSTSSSKNWIMKQLQMSSLIISPKNDQNPGICNIIGYVIKKIKIIFIFIGIAALADYLTKHFTALYHRLIRAKYGLYKVSSPSNLQLQPDLQGCVSSRLTCPDQTDVSKKF